MFNFLKFLIQNDSPSNWQVGFQSPATPIMEGIIDLHNFVMLFLILILTVVSWFLGRALYLFRESRNKTTTKFTHDPVIETIWTIVPAFILIVIAAPSFSLLYSMDDVPTPTFTVKAIGHQWYWSYELDVASNQVFFQDFKPEFFVGRYPTAGKTKGFKFGYKFYDQDWQFGHRARVYEILKQKHRLARPYTVIPKAFIKHTIAANPVTQIHRGTFLGYCLDPSVFFPALITDCKMIKMMQYRNRWSLLYFEENFEYQRKHGRISDTLYEAVWYNKLGLAAKIHKSIAKYRKEVSRFYYFGVRPEEAMPPRGKFLEPGDKKSYNFNSSPGRVKGAFDSDPIKLFFKFTKQNPRWRLIQSPAWVQSRLEFFRTYPKPKFVPFEELVEHAKIVKPLKRSFKESFILLKRTPLEASFGLLNKTEYPASYKALHKKFGEKINTLRFVLPDILKIRKNLEWEDKLLEYKARTQKFEVPQDGERFVKLIHKSKGGLIENVGLRKMVVSNLRKIMAKAKLVPKYWEEARQIIDSDEETPTMSLDQAIMLYTRTANKVIDKVSPKNISAEYSFKHKNKAYIDLIKPTFDLDHITRPHKLFWPSFTFLSAKYRSLEFITWRFFNIKFDSFMVQSNELPKGGKRLLEVDNRLVLPAKTHIRLLVTSADVIHSWSVPSLGIKVDAVPGRLNQAFIYLNRKGVFYGQCSELCGVNHGFMPIVVESVTPTKFGQWVTKLNGPTKLDDIINGDWTLGRNPKYPKVPYPFEVSGSGRMQPSDVLRAYHAKFLADPEERGKSPYYWYRDPTTEFWHLIDKKSGKEVTF